MEEVLTKSNEVINTPETIAGRFTQKKIYLFLGTVLAVVAIGVVYYALNTQNPNYNSQSPVTATPTVTSTTDTKITFPAAPAGLFIDVGKPFSYQIATTENLTEKAYVLQKEATTALQVNISQTGLIFWTPTEKELGVNTLAVVVSSGSRHGTLVLSVTVQKPVVAVQNKNIIATNVQIPSQPIFYKLEDKKQLWVMNRDGSNKKFTGVTLGGSALPQNMTNFGGVVYTGVDPKDSNESELAVYVFYTATKQTKRIPATASIKGLNAYLGGFSISPDSTNILYDVVFTNPKSLEIGYEAAKTFWYDLNTGKQVEIKDVSAGDIVWGSAPDTVITAQKDGMYLSDLNTMKITKIDSMPNSIPSSYNLLQVNADVNIRLAGDTQNGVKLFLRNGVEETVIDEGPWASIQPFFCLTPDKKKILYQINKGIRAVDIDKKQKMDIKSSVSDEEYVLKGCYWTSATTVMIEHIKGMYTSNFVELDITTGTTKMLTTTGNVQLSN